MSDMPQDFEAMKSRLDEIADEVSAEGISLDEALALYEEAVKLGLAACDVSEADILVPEEGVEGVAEGAEIAVEGSVEAEGVSGDAAAMADAVAVAEVVEYTDDAAVVAIAEEVAVESAAATDSVESNL